MIRYAELIQALNHYLEKQYPQISRYGNDTAEGWEKPYFFVECVPYESNYQTGNYRKNACVMKLTYFQETVSEQDQLEKVEEIRELLGMKFCVGERKLDIKNYTYEYVGEYHNILQLSFKLSWMERLHRKEENELIETIDLTVKRGDR